ncbi:unnamed protein product [Camellia sinensis]
MEGIPKVAIPVNQATSERAETGAAAAAPETISHFVPSITFYGAHKSTDFTGAFESLICLDMRYQTISIRNGSRQGKGGGISL